MSQPFLAELRIFPFGFPPKGWAFCNGQLMSVTQNQALFSLLGTTYGGDGRTNFGLPNLQGQVPIHIGNGYALGQVGGQALVALTIQQLPTHNHFVSAVNAPAPASQAGVEAGPTKYPGQPIVSLPNNATTPGNIYGTGNPASAMSSKAVSNVGGGQPHNNMMPFLTLNFCIALQGIFPSQN